MSETGTFLSNCLIGKALLEEIDDYVDRWHDGGEEGSLAAYLGMTDREYEAWVINSSALSFIIMGRRYQKPFYQVLDEQVQLPMAARSGAAADVRELVKWLKKSGRM